MDKATKKEQKREAFLKACDEIGRQSPVHRKLSAIADELSDGTAKDKTKIQNVFYSFKSDPPRSTPDDSWASRLYERFPYKEVYEILKPHFAIQQKEADNPVEERIFSDLPSLLHRINELKAQVRTLTKEKHEAQEENRRLTQRARELLQDPKNKNNAELREALRFMEENGKG